MTTAVPLYPEKLRLNIDPESLGFQKLSQLESYIAGIQAGETC